ncbi:IS110 family transposase [Rhizobium lentis]|uniref:transposase n=1 Tax=Rhizobium lentis TaxID=1138194 RepID=UPI001C839E5C|nr:transposase [Rhizobium lentis]MBX5013977.1 IS110 family transposase [Rhizobium lentis]
MPGVGFVTASALSSIVPDPQAFKSRKHFAAWLGLMPRQNSSGGKARLSHISKQGNPYIRQLLVHGATSVLHFIRRDGGTDTGWIGGLLRRRPPKVAAVALANKMARIAWSIMTRGGEYEEIDDLRAVQPALTEAFDAALLGARTRAVRNRTLRANGMRTYATHRSPAGRRSDRNPFGI